MHNKFLLAVLMAAATTIAVDANAKKPAAKPAAEKKAQEVAVDVPPPSGSWEAPQAPANGHIWSAGYYEWKDSRYSWKPGGWIVDRPGMDYRQHKWVQRPDGKWVLTGGDWVNEKVAGNKN